MTNTGYFNHYTTNTLWNPSPPKTLVFELLPGSPSLPSTRQQQSELEDGRDFMHTEEVIISAGTRAAARPAVAVAWRARAPILASFLTV